MAKPVVIVGGGIIGIATSYFLAKLGRHPVIVLEANAIAQGSTGLSSGGFRSQFSSREETLLSVRSRELWLEIEKQFGVDLGLSRVGYCAILTTQAEVDAFRARYEYQHELGIRIVELSSARIGLLVPGLRTSDISLAMLSPDDGYASPSDVTLTLAGLARDLGVEIRQRTPAVAIRTLNGRVTSVQTPDSEIECDFVVNAAGIEAAAVAALVGASISVIPARQHQFVTERLGWLPASFPCLVDASLDLYLRPEGGGVLLGVADPAEVGSQSLVVNWDLAQTLHTKLQWRWPRLAGVGIAHAWVGCYEISPDHKPLIGELGNPRGFVYANGFSGHGFMLGLATGEAVAELVHYGEARTIELSPFSLERLG